MHTHMHARTRTFTHTHTQHMHTHEQTHAHTYKQPDYYNPPPMLRLIKKNMLKYLYYFVLQTN